jgi:hypothetical protein
VKLCFSGVPSAPWQEILLQVVFGLLGVYVNKVCLEYLVKKVCWLGNCVLSYAVRVPGTWDPSSSVLHIWMEYPVMSVLMSVKSYTIRRSMKSFSDKIFPYSCRQGIASLLVNAGKFLWEMAWMGPTVKLDEIHMLQIFLPLLMFSLPSSYFPSTLSAFSFSWIK